MKKSLGRRNKAATNDAQHTPMLRQLQTDHCTVNIALNTTYNANKDVVPFVGIMFSVFAKTPLDILTMELDIRFGDNTDLAVEVYSYQGRYDLIFNKPIFWTLIANTTAVPAPEGTGAIIPVSDFDTVSIGQMERRSFYITMKAPILQYNVGALVKTDEVALQTADIDLLAGVGFSEYKFPEAIDTLVDPQFTGVLHYAHKSTCGQVSSTVDYEFILNEKLRVGVLEEFTRQVDAAVTELLQKDSRLQVLQETHSLQKDGDAQTAIEPYTGKCPNEVCSSLLKTSVGFVHDDSLRSGQLIYSLYQFADVITKAVGQQMSGVEVLYIGPRDVAATFGIVLGGVPQGEIMNAVQQEYFADVTIDFLSGASGGERVLDMQIDEQVDNDGSIQVLGKLLGASYQPVAAFANGLESSFREGQDVYVERLIFDRLRPNAINEVGGIEFFEGISSVGGTVDVDLDAAARPQVAGNGGSSSLLIIAIVSAVGGVALILLVCWYCVSRIKSAEEMREVKRYRERMKAERRARRQDGKETLLRKDDDPEDTRNYREGITSSSEEGSDGQNGPFSDDDARQSTVATAIAADDAEFADFPEDRNDKGQRPLQEDFPTKALGDDLPGSSARRDTPRPAKPDTDNPESFEDKKGVAEEQEKLRLEIETLQAAVAAAEGDGTIDSQKPNAALEAPIPPTQEGTSPAELSKVMTEQPKLPAKKVTGSHSAQYQPPAALGGTSGSSPKKPQLQSSKTEDDLASSPRKRVAPKPTKSMDTSPQKRVPPNPSKTMNGNDFPSQAPFVPPSAKPKCASPAALSRFIKAEPKTSTDRLSGSRSVQYQPPAALGSTSKKVKEAEDVPSGSPRKRPPFRGNTKSLDESNLSLGKIIEGSDTPGTASKAPTSANLKSASPAELSKFMKEKPKLPTKNLSGSRSVQYQPPAALGVTPKKFKEAEDAHGSPQKRVAPKPTKSMGSNEVLSTSSPQKRVPPKPSKSMDSNDFPSQAPFVPARTKTKGASPAALARFMKAEPKTSTDKLSGSRSVQLPAALRPTSKKVKEAEDVSSGSLRKRPPVRGNTKSLDQSNFKGELSQNARAPTPLGKINEGRVPPATASDALTSIKAKDASQKPPTRKYQPPGALGPTTKVIEAEDVPTGSPRRRLPVRGASQSLDETSFKKELSPLAIPSKYKVGQGKDRPGVASMTPTIVETGSQPASPLSPVKPIVRP